MRCALALLGFALLCRPVAAQVAGLPVSGPSGRAGWHAGLITTWSGEGTRVGVAGGVARGRVSLEAVQRFSGAAAGGLAAFRLAGTAPSPFRLDLFAGGGRSAGQGRGIAGLAVAFAVVTPVAVLRPWVSPRADRSGGHTGGAFSAGVDFVLRQGLAVGVVGDRLQGHALAGLSISFGHHLPGL